MVATRGITKEIRKFILSNVEMHANDITAFTCDEFGISRQATNRHLRALIDDEKLIATGSTRNKEYFLKENNLFIDNYKDIQNLKEHIVWQKDISNLLSEYDEDQTDILHYGFTEILNNAIDHSGAAIVGIDVSETAIWLRISIVDYGIGIFKKIKDELGLDYEKEAILELAKGKLTTDPSKHTGEGIFFTSRAFDEFIIGSRGLIFSYEDHDKYDHLFEGKMKREDGTIVIMKLYKDTKRKLSDVFNEYATGEEYQFDKTIIPVILAQQEDQVLVSRSQAKRVLHRLKRFKTVVLNFEGVNKIGQAFADEIFRVFSETHKEINITAINCNKEVKKMISRAKSH